jgi:cytochrome P450
MKQADGDEFAATLPNEMCHFRHLLLRPEKMSIEAAPLVPPTLPIHERRLPPFLALWMGVRNNLSTWPRQVFEEPFWRTNFFGGDVLVVSDPAAVRHVLNEAPEKYRRPVMARRALRPIGGNGVFLAEGADWRRQRKMLSPLFTPASVGLLVPHFHAAADHLLRRLQGLSQTNLVRDFQDAALEAVFRALFSLPETERREKLGAMARFYLQGVGRPNVFDIFAHNEQSFPLILRGRARFRARWQEAVDGVIEERRGATKTLHGRDLLDLLLAARDPETGEGLSTAEIRDQSATMLVAGFETTARLMFWLCYLLALDLAEQDRIRAELAAFAPERVGSLDDLNHWPRLKMALLEALRLYPPAPHVLRVAIAEDVVCGQPVKKWTQVWVSPWVLHRHRAYWDRPEAFMPDRFAGKPAPWTSGAPYMPFGAGPRICIGAGFALAEAQIVLAHFLARYRIRLADKKPVLPVGAVTISPSREPAFRLERV